MEAPVYDERFKCRRTIPKNSGQQEAFEHLDGAISVGTVIDHHVKIKIILDRPTHFAINVDVTKATK
jgi:hypothetical protein